MFPNFQLTQKIADYSQGDIKRVLGATGGVEIAK
jgi:hypothetical protein